MQLPGVPVGADHCVLHLRRRWPLVGQDEALPTQPVRVQQEEQGAEGQTPPLGQRQQELEAEVRWFDFFLRL